MMKVRWIDFISPHEDLIKDDWTGASEVAQRKVPNEQGGLMIAGPTVAADFLTLALHTAMSSVPRFFEVVEGPHGTGEVFSCGEFVERFAGDEALAAFALLVQLDDEICDAGLQGQTRTPSDIVRLRRPNSDSGVVEM